MQKIKKSFRYSSDLKDNLVGVKVIKQILKRHFNWSYS